MPNYSEKTEQRRDRPPQSEELFRFMVESVRDYAIFATDTEGRIANWNIGAERIFGYTEAEIVGQNGSILFTPEDIQSGMPARELEEAATEGRAEDERWHVRKDSSRFWASGIVTPLKDVDGNLCGFVKVARDQSKRRQAEEMRIRRAALQADVRAAISLSGTTLRTILQQCAEAMVEHLNVAFARIWLLNKEENVLELQASAGMYTHLDGPHARVPVGQFKIGLIAQDRQPHLTNNVINDPRVSDREWAKREGMVAFAGYPLIVENQLVGVMAMFAREPLTEQTLGALASVADAIAQGIERKRTEDDLRESEERYRIVAETASDAIITINEDSTLLFVNRAAEHIFGYTAREMLGQKLTMLMPEYLRHLHHAGMRRYIATGQRHISWESVELPGLHKSGQEISLELSFGEFKRDGKHVFTGIARDITERKRAELRQAAQYAVTRALAESSTLGEATARILQSICQSLDWSFGALWSIDRQANVLRCVEIWHQLSVNVADFEMASKQIAFPPGVGLPGHVWQRGAPIWISDVTKNDNFPRAAFADREGLYGACGFPILLGSEVLGVMEFFSKEIREPDQALLNTMMTIGSQIGQFMERRRAEEERAKLLVREQQARQEAEEANRLKDEFLATLSHELRTPMTAIIGWSHLLHTRTLDDEATSRALETIRRNARSQLQLIDDLLDVSRIITGKLRLDVHLVELPTVIEAAVDAVRPAAEAKEIRLEVRLDPSAPPVSGDANRLQQVVWNLLTNAVKFTPRGGHVQVRLEQVNSHVEITVTDTGKGIRPEFLPHVFDRFRQADASITREHSGLGIGLAIVRHLVELHGGTVRAESAGEGQGSSFIVSLPFMAARRELTKAEIVHPKVESHALLECPPSLNGLRVLVVDDEADTRDLVRVVLGQCGSEVTTLASAAEALKALEESKPDVLISDIGMPEEDGYSLIRKVRDLEFKRGGRIPAIALTAYARGEDRLRALTAGFQVHMPKPIEPVELIAVVASLAGRTGKG